MTDERGAPAALRPLWLITVGAATGAGTTTALSPAAPGWVAAASAVLGLVAALVALRRGGAGASMLWLIAGLGLAGGHGLAQAADRRELVRLIEAEDPVWVRARLVVTDGWAATRWGRRAAVRVLEARHDQLRVPALPRARLEVRGDVRPEDLPPPGRVVEALVSIRGEPSSPLLVATSHRLVEPPGGARVLPTVRDALARRLLQAAGTDLGRLRAAELAAALSLGRRDLVPASRREGWRRSGLAHVLAVSGLHVGLVAGLAWLALAAGGASPTATRVALLVVLPGYALLAGASPSAVRAALMGVVFVGARLLGRAILPMAAVLLTASILLVADPALIGEVSFQLTVVLTAALVRWGPALTAAIPLPTWLAGAIAVPVVAQLAAAPLVAIHFGSAIPGAAAANLLVPVLLAPLVVASVAATVAAPLSAAIAGWLLDLAGAATGLLWLAGAPARMSELVPPPLPLALTAVLLVLGVGALLPGRPSRPAAMAYVGCLAIAVAAWLAVPPPGGTRIELLPVANGLAVRASAGGDHLLMDGGGRPREAAELLAASRVRRLRAVIASHGDEDHIGGLAMVLETCRVDTLVVPAWLLGEPEVVPLLRIARRRGTRVLPAARGTRLALGAIRLDVLWPPALLPPRSDNERSLVLRLEADDAVALLTGDIGRESERRLAATTDLRAELLLVPHHGSRGSATPALLDGCAPRLALIPAGPENLHHHPSPEVLERLDERGVDYRMPIRDGRCGARRDGAGWLLYP
ncbi:MAG: DNA internalization-related competence protein ComEC/Rec2 [Thermoanaerobaculales bacterium]|nr:DNA internalization-related competence protein ComEC/Rec2 [Thermoanaerobaculales bacterium]